MKKRLTDAQWDWVAKKYIEGRYSSPVLAEFIGLPAQTVNKQIEKRTGGKPQQSQIAFEELQTMRHEFDALATVPNVRKRRSIYSLAQMHWLGARFMEGYKLWELGAFAYMAPEYVGIRLNQLGYHPKRGKKCGQELPPLHDKRAEFLALADEEG